MEQFDVAIVGAGPAGSAAAISLAQKGYSVVLIDKQFFPREKLCGDFLNPINWPLLEQMGVVRGLLSLPHKQVTAFRISAFSGEEATIPFPLRNGAHPFGLGMRRFYLDNFLLKRAEDEGASVLQGSRVMGLKWGNGGWSLTLGNHSMEHRLHATILIGADGRNSWAAHRLGLTQPRENSGKFLAFQLHVRGAKNVNGEVQIHLFPGGYAGVVELGEGMVNLCFVVEREKVKDGFSYELFLDNSLSRNPRLRDVLEGARPAGGMRSTYPVYFSPRRLYGDGFLLVGDAACVTEPVTGEGVYFALRSGELAAEAIHHAFRQRNFSSQQLSSYQRACQRAFSLRQRANGVIRALIYRPSLLAPLIRLSSKSCFPMIHLVRWACGASFHGVKCR